MIDDFGHISLQDGRVGGFGFRWRGREFRLDVDEAAATPPAREAECRIRLAARAGRVPSTALAAARRPDAFRIAKRLSMTLPAGWNMILQADHVLTLSTETRMALPATIGALLIPATRFALELAPYLDLLEQYGMDMEA